MSSANFSVRWVHRNPVLVTGFVPSSVEWLGSILQIINDGRLLSNPLRSIEPNELGLENSFDWQDRTSESILLEEFWNDILRLPPWRKNKPFIPQGLRYLPNSPSGPAL